MDLDELFEVLDSEAGKSSRAFVVDTKDSQATGFRVHFESDIGQHSSSSPSIAATRPIVNTALGAAMVRLPPTAGEVARTMEAIRQASGRDDQRYGRARRQAMPVDRRR
jgi:hypothetical protein